MVRERGYPTVRQLRRWVRAWQTSGEKVESVKRKPRYSDEQKLAAVEHYLNHGRCLAFTRRTLGYPSDVVLNRWLDERHPAKRRLISGIHKEVKRQAVREFCTRLVPARDIAQKMGVSRRVLYK